MVYLNIEKIVKLIEKEHKVYVFEKFKLNDGKYYYTLYFREKPVKNYEVKKE